MAMHNRKAFFMGSATFGGEGKSCRNLSSELWVKSGNELFDKKGEEQWLE